MQPAHELLSLIHSEGGSKAVKHANEMRYMTPLTPPQE